MSYTKNLLVSVTFQIPNGVPASLFFPLLNGNQQYVASNPKTYSSLFTRPSDMSCSTIAHQRPPGIYEGEVYVSGPGTYILTSNIKCCWCQQLMFFHLIPRFHPENFISNLWSQMYFCSYYVGNFYSFNLEVTRYVRELFSGVTFDSPCE